MHHVTSSNNIRQAASSPPPSPPPLPLPTYMHILSYYALKYEFKTPGWYDLSLPLNVPGMAWHTIYIL
jgi:hypothetical protein